jgi:urease beta subunit
MKHSHLTFVVFSTIAAVTVSVSGHAASGAPDAWPDQAYRVEWEEAHIPEDVAASAKIAMPVTVRNNGDRAWPASQVFVSYHWFRDDRLVVWDGTRTALPRDLRPGSRAALSAGVATPNEPGSYVLMVTLVHEQVTWFEHKGAATVVRPVAVRPPTQSVDFGISGSTPCPAAP